MQYNWIIGVLWQRRPLLVPLITRGGLKEELSKTKKDKISKIGLTLGCTGKVDSLKEEDFVAIWYFQELLVYPLDPFCESLVNLLDMEAKGKVR